MAEWFRRKNQNITTKIRRDTKDGMWVKCPSCGEVVYSNLLKNSFNLCPSCNHHFNFTYQDYIDLLIDDENKNYIGKDIFSADPLNFSSSKNYKEQLKNAESKTGKNDALVALEGKINNKLTHHGSLLAWTGFLSKAPKDKIIICQPNNQEIALMGELSAETLQNKGVRGCIIDGGCRDLEFILNIDFPVWCNFYTPRDVVSYWSPTKLEQTVTIGNTKIHNDDYVMADIDGVVIIPKDKAEEILIKSEKLISTESEIRKAIREGMDPQKAYLKYSVF